MCQRIKYFSREFTSSLHFLNLALETSFFAHSFSFFGGISGYKANISVQLVSIFTGTQIHPKKQTKQKRKQTSKITKVKRPK